MSDQRQQIAYSMARMVADWYAAGATHQQVGDELDSRILYCGGVVFDSLLENKESFVLTKFFLMSLKWSYGILAAHGHVEKWQKADFAECEEEWSKWKGLPPGVKKSELVMCVVALNKFAEIKLSGKPFIVIDRNKSEK